MPKTIKLEKQCPFCGKTHVMEFDALSYNVGMEKYMSGALCQNAFPDFTPSQREFIMTGICDECWDSM